MRQRNKLLSYCLSLAATSVVILFLAVGKVSADTFNANNIINDVVFDNTSTMSSSLIDNWLNANFPNSCISTNSGFQARIPSGYSSSGGFTYGDFGSSGQVISAAAQAYGINPQVLIVTLEKEQSLISGRSSSTYCSSTEHMYASAMGYGCPDSGGTYNWSGVSLYRRNGVEHTSTGSTCVNSASKAGFSQQVIRAAWLLKFGEQRSEGNTGWAVINGGWNNSDDLQACYGGPMTQGTWHRCPNDTATFYDGYITIDGTAVHVEDGATATLYWYTPHFSGNQSFFALFNSWFGSPYTSSIPYNWSIVSQEAYTDSSRTQPFTDGISIAPGQTAYLRVRVRNFGYKTWDQSFVHLGTTHALDRNSAFANNSWLTTARLKMTEASVLPGGAATFEFSITAPATTGSYYEYFNLVADGIAWMNDFGMHFPIDVVASRAASNSSNTSLDSGQSINVGQFLLSPDTQSTLSLQTDGNLVLYSNFKPVWSSQVFTTKANFLAMQADGNLVEYDNTGHALWASGTPSHPGAYLTTQTDGNLVIYSSSNVPLWSTSTFSIPNHLSRVNKFLDKNTVLLAGQSLMTANGNYSLILQADGNLVLYAQSKAVWNSQTAGKGASTLWMQPDGNLVLYSASTPTWSSGTAGVK
jgi:hypothetical protein